MTITRVDPVGSLAQLMREGSRADHEEAEASGFITDLCSGRIPVSGYVAYLRGLEQAYAALEDLGRRLADHPAGRAVVDPRLERGGRLADDLDHWAGPGWDQVPYADPAVTAYVRRLEGVDADPLLLVAHHYTRYLGDLAGGQAVGRAVARTYQPPAGRGLAFYDFADVGKPKPYRDAYRARVDALGVSQADAERVVDEVRYAFRLNRDMFTELGARFPPAA